MPEDAPAERIAPLPWMTDAPAQAVLAALGPGMARFAGGPVRDALLGRPVADLDLATPLLPAEAAARLEAAGIKVVPTGLLHGTITAIVPPRQFEITTLRRDVETFGRHARVAFSASWAEDAARRDFTMNALYLDAEGDVFDYVGGLEDLHAGRVRFVGAARQRIREDVLRLLRFYRFHAHYGRGPADAEARAAARGLRDLLPALSAERVSAELRKLLAAPDPLPTLEMMAEDGVLAIVLPEARAGERLRRLVPSEDQPDPIRRLAALAVSNEQDAASVARRLKLTVRERDRLRAIASHSIDLDADPRAQRRALYALGPALYEDLVLLEAAARGKNGAALRARAKEAPLPRFPLKGRDVTAHGVEPGPDVGRILEAIETWWIEGDFHADRKACLAELDRRIGRARA